MVVVAPVFNPTVTPLRPVPEVVIRPEIVYVICVLPVIVRDNDLLAACEASSGAAAGHLSPRGGRAGKVYTASDPGEVAEWLKALAC